MSEIKFTIATLAVIGLAVVLVRIAVVIGRIIRAIGISELVVRLKFHNYNGTTKIKK
jgi:hypothetical protein